MNRFLKKTQGNFEASIKRNPKSTLINFYIKLLSIARPVYFRNEFLVIKGFIRKSYSNQQSIIFFTVHKSASTLLKSTVKTLLSDKKLITIDFSGFLSKKQQQEYYNNGNTMNRLLKKKGYFYGAFRSYYDFPCLEEYKIILVLRDPRDVLTSYYFSTLYNHPLGRKEVFEEREKTANMSIDEFVLQRSVDFKKKYRDYCKFLVGKENVLLLKYEDMITEFREWLCKLSSFLGLSNNTEVIEHIVSKTSFKVDKENPNSFIRNIKSNDYKNKLKPETITALTNIFKEELITLEYSLD